MMECRDSKRRGRPAGSTGVEDGWGEQCGVQAGKQRIERSKERRLKVEETNFLGRFGLSALWGYSRIC